MGAMTTLRWIAALLAAGAAAVAPAAAGRSSTAPVCHLVVHHGERSG